MPRPRKTSSLDVAKKAGVSQTTVSFVLNGAANQAIRPETRDRVLKAAEELRYRPNRLARNLLTGKSQLIGVVVTTLNHPVYAAMVQGLQEECYRHEYRLLLTNTMADPILVRDQVNFLLEQRVAGVIDICDSAPVAMVAHWLSEIEADGIHGVMLDNTHYAETVDCVVTDDVAGARLAVQHLIDLGHRRIAHLCAGRTSNPVSTSRERWQGYELALREAGLEVDPLLVQGESYDPTEVRAAMSRLLALTEPPTAVFAASDAMAEAGMAVLRERALRVPEEIALVGFGDLPMAQYLNLTTVRQDFVEMGRQAARLLLSRLAEPSRAPKTVRLPTRLVLRETSGHRIGSRRD